MKRRAVCRDVAYIVVAAVVVACGSGSSGGSGGVNGVGSATVTGPVQGKAFAPMDAVAYSPGSISIVDFAGLCAHGLSDAKAGATYIYITLDNGFQVGTTQVGTTLDVRDEVWDSQCNSVDHIAGSGSVTLTSVDSSGVQGTFDVTVALDGHLTGSFSAAMCTMPGNTACK